MNGINIKMRMMLELHWFGQRWFLQMNKMTMEDSDDREQKAKPRL
jgi:hypothetical protein